MQILINLTDTIKKYETKLKKKTYTYVVLNSGCMLVALTGSN